MGKLCGVFFVVVVLVTSMLYVHLVVLIAI